MSKNKFIIIFIVLVFMCLCVSLVGGAAYYLSQKTNTEEATKDDTKTAEIIEEIEKVLPPVYTIANCKLYSIDPVTNTTTEIPFTNPTKVDCFDKKVFRGKFAMINPDYSIVDYEKVSESSEYLLDVGNAKVTEIEYDTLDRNPATNYNPNNKKLYTYVHETGVYEGTLSNPLQKMIFPFKSTIFGRGGMYLDDVNLRFSPDMNKIMFIETYSSEMKDGSDYYPIHIFDLTGSMYYEGTGTFAEWIDNNRIVYLDTDYTSPTKGKILVEEIGTGVTEVLGTITGGYSIDVDQDLELIAIGFSAIDGNFDSANMRTSVFSTVDLSKPYQTSGKLAFPFILSATSFVAKNSVDCTGDFTDEGPLACPMDGIFSFYETDVAVHKTDTSKTTKIFKFDKPALPNLK